jgi:hypothetical protein
MGLYNTFKAGDAVKHARKLAAFLDRLEVGEEYSIKREARDRSRVKDYGRIISKGTRFVIVEWPEGYRESFLPDELYKSMPKGTLTRRELEI